ncbi:MAG: hypothetical protein IKN38_10530, partial [Clostridia bacterium]|nr:hypothetical protein [Clostridia bacterium]
GELRFKYPENASVRSQDLEPIYHDCGQFYIFSNDLYDINGEKVRAAPHDIYPPAKIYYNSEGAPKKNLAYIMPEIEVQDIDTPEDWEIAEIKYKIIKNNKNIL